MKNYWRNVPIILLIVILIGIIIFFTLPKESKGVDLESNDNELREEAQILEEVEDSMKLRFEGFPITYRFVKEGECGDHEPTRIKKAFDKIRFATGGVVSFEELESFDGLANIDISCSYIEDCYKLTHGKVDKNEGTESYCAHEFGNWKITETEGEIIKKAEIEFIGYYGLRETGNSRGKGASGFGVGTCGYVNIELHEILHAMGYDYNYDNFNSVMSPDVEALGKDITLKINECLDEEREIDQWIVDDLINIYS